jgi:hypothetical protein
MRSVPLFIAFRYAAGSQLTFPVPAVIEVTLLSPTVDVVPVKPAPIVIVNVLGYFKITIPEPPLPAARNIPFPASTT